MNLLKKNYIKFECALLCKSQFRLVVSLLPLKGNNNHGLFWQRQQNRGGNAVNA